MKQRFLLSLLLLAPSLAYADALSARGAGLFVLMLLMLGGTLLVALCFLIAMYSWPRWRGLPYLLGVPLLVLTWMFLASSDHHNGYLILLLLALLLNGLVWAREFRPRPMRVAGGIALAIGGVGMVMVLLLT